MPRPECRATFRKEPDGIAVEYSVMNSTAANLYVLDVLWSYDSNGAIIADPQPAYRSVSGTILQCGRCFYPVPRLRRVEQTIVPFARKVEPSQTLSAKFILKDKIAEYNPYARLAAPPDVETVGCETIEFWLSYLPADPEVAESPSGISDCIRVSGPGLLKRIETVRIASAAIRLQVLKSTNAFFERMVPHQ